MKLEAVAARGKKRDFLDLYAVAQSGPSIREMVQWFEEKYQSVRYNLVHLIKSLSYFEDAEDDPSPILLHPIEWTDVKRFFHSEAARLLP
ncbi:MAG: hypothetical protein HYV02_06225 [Deltaproteobacteria bacterium]|nr:hypothetical protein [Deltaproteobacteria bacterium]